MATSSRGSATSSASRTRASGQRTTRKSSSNERSQSARTAARSTASRAKRETKNLTRQTETKAAHAKDQIQERVQSLVDQRTSDAAQQVAATVEAIRAAGAELRKQGNDGPARIAEQLAERGEMFARYLDAADGRQMLRDAENFASRNPWAVVGGGLVAGFAASRFIKASADQRSGSAGSGGSRW